MRRRSVLAATSLIAAMVQPALAQSWPTHPVKVLKNYLGPDHGCHTPSVNLRA